MCPKSPYDCGYIYELWGEHTGPPDPFPVYIWVVVGVQRTLGVEASIKKNQGTPIPAGSLGVSGCMLSRAFLAKEERGKNSTSLLFILKHGRDIWILWFAGDAWNCSSFLDFLGWAGKAWEQQPTLHSWGAHCMGATLPVISRAEGCLSWMLC